MDSYDAEMHVLRQKENVRRAADAYMTTSHLDQAAEPRGLQHAYQRARARLGSRLVTLGYRLQGELDPLPMAYPVGK